MNKHIIRTLTMLVIIACLGSAGAQTTKVIHEIGVTDNGNVYPGFSFRNRATTAASSNNYFLGYLLALDKDTLAATAGDRSTLQWWTDSTGLHVARASGAVTLYFENGASATTPSITHTQIGQMTVEDGGSSPTGLPIVKIRSGDGNTVAGGWSSAGGFRVGGTPGATPAAGQIDVIDKYLVNGTQIAASNLLNGVTGTAGTPVVLQTSPSITTPTVTTQMVGNRTGGLDWSIVGETDGTPQGYIVFDHTLGGVRLSDKNAVTVANFSTGGTVIGNATGGGKGAGTLNLAGDFYNNGVLTNSVTAPTISAGFCTSPAVTANGTYAFSINVGTSCGVSTATLSMPTATNGWVCTFADTSFPASHIVSQTGGVTNTVTLTQYSRTTGSAINWTDSEIVRGRCVAY